MPDQDPRRVQGAADDGRDEAVVDAAFSGLDNDLIKVDEFDGDGPAGQEDNGGAPAASRSGSGRDGGDEDFDETSAGGLQYPDDVPTSGAGRR